IREPPIQNRKGRPRNKRLTGALEGPAQGGGARAAARNGGRKCGLCREVGHTAPRCPLNQNIP
ncbi:hypothetical protein CPB83DRAFT_776732, partial [Crepidotus variabilis]